MTTKQSALLKLPLPLHTQLRALAQARGTTMTEIIADVIAKAIEGGELRDETPGVEIVVTDETITLRAGDLTLPAMTMAEARDVANYLEEVVARTIVRGIMLESGAVLTVRRRGSGVSLEPDPRGEQRHVMAPTVARDLARQIRKAADSLKQ